MTARFGEAPIFDVVGLDEVLGSASTAPGSAIDHVSGILLRSADSETRTGTWQITLGPAAGGESRRLLVAGTYLVMQGPASRMAVGAGGVTLFEVSGPASPVPFEDVAVVPAGLRGLSFDLPPGACEPRTCTIRIGVRDATYGVQRVAIETLRPVTASFGMPPSQARTVVIVLTLAAAAGLAYLSLEALGRRAMRAT